MYLYLAKKGVDHDVNRDIVLVDLEFVVFTDFRRGVEDQGVGLLGVVEGNSRPCTLHAQTSPVTGARHVILDGNLQC